MAKHMICKTIICKVNGITLLDLNSDIKTLCEDKDNVEVDVSVDNGVDDSHQQSVQSNNDNEVESDFYDEEDINEDNEDMNEDNEDMNEDSEESKPIGGKNPNQVLEIEKVENGIESVRQYVSTTRKQGKVWHQCKWKTGRNVCNYGSKWSGAVVNHIRAHLGLKPFRCTYCNKYFTIACNLKNHMRIHHNIRAKIVLNGGRRMKKRSTRADSGKGSQLRIFKPSFINDKVDNNAYAPQHSQHSRRYGPKRTLKRNQKYIDYTEDFEEEDEKEVEEEVEEKDNDINNEVEDEEEAEERNRLFYEKTKEDEEEEVSKYIIRRKYNKISWFVCSWNPRQCKFRSQLKAEVINHVHKHQNLHKTIDGQQLTNQVNHKSFKCNFKGCQFQTINERTLQMHKIRHKRCSSHKY